MAITVDNLEIAIQAKSTNAVKAVNDLKSALSGLNRALGSINKKDGSTSIDKLANNLSRLNLALGNLSDSNVAKVRKLAGAMSVLASSTKAFKNVGNISSKVSDVTKTVRSADTASAVGSASGKSPSDVNKIASAWMNVKKALGLVDENGKKVTGTFSKLMKTFGRIALYRMIRSAIKAVSDAFKEGLTNAYLFSKNPENGFLRLAETLDKIKTATSQMVNQLGAMFGEFKQLIAPLVLKVVEMVRSAAQFFTEFLAAINGESTYLFATDVATAWGEASDNVKKFKQQLLGLDELNNLSSGNGDTDKLANNVDDMFKVFEVNSKMANIVNTVKQALTDLKGLIIGATVAIGLILTLSGANIPLGLALLAYGTYEGVKAISENWSKMTDLVSNRIAILDGLIGGSLLGIGAILAFSGASLPLGLGMLVVGATSLGVSAIAGYWDSLSEQMKTSIGLLMTILSGELFALGAILAFSGANVPLGISFMASGAVTLGSVIALNWKGITKAVSKAIKGINTILATSGFVLGGVLAFSGANVPLGIGLMIASGALGVANIAVNWKSTSNSVKSSIKSINTLLGGAGLAIGGVLAFSGANLPLGIGMMVASGALLATSLVTDWGFVSEQLKQVLSTIALAIAGAGLAVGAVLAFSGASVPLGIGLMLASGGLVAGTAAVNWDSLPKVMRSKFDAVTTIVSGAGIAMGAMLALSGANPALGIGLIVANGALLGTEVVLNWDWVLDKLKGAWEKIKSWWKNDVIGGVKEAVAELEGLWDFDLNKDGFIGTAPEKKTTKEGANTFVSGNYGKVDSYIKDDGKSKTAFGAILDVGSDIKKEISSEFKAFDNFMGDLFTGELFKENPYTVDKKGGNTTVSRKYAIGGIPTQGTLFYAGEAGPEFIGNIGNTSAVANTEQMTDAIYRASYMGMAKALAENSSNGMNGFEAATTDDLWLVLRKKSNQRNKMTGNFAM